ncbi:hypothetical protein COA01_34735 [Bacillus cereus]|uniref:hypothetical protein n=1 Tax=Bacillus cereus TaxID=1396 RepID=UPI000BFE353A|nr:hypothetical protein [Bacillus cereus]PGP11979.1 hypothetical protein COA01_34735 [Bacillus cereus]
MDFLLYLSHIMKDAMFISAFLAPILFYGLKRYKLALTSFIAIGFSLVMLSMYHSTISFVAEESRMFLYLTQALNICAASLVLIKIFKRRVKTNMPTNVNNRLEEKDNEEENVYVDGMTGLLRTKGVVREERNNKRYRA